MPITATPYTQVYGPLALPGVTCQLWLDAADPLGNGSVPANGATVSTWVDKSRNGYNATQVGGSLTYSSSLQGIAFDGGASSYYTLPSATFSTGNTFYTIFIVVQTSLPGGHYSHMIGFGDLFTANGAVDMPIYPNGLVETGWWTNNIQSATGVVTANTRIILGTTYNSSGIFLYGNGKSIASSASIGTRNGVATTGYVGCPPGGGSNSPPGGAGTQNLIGTMHELLVYSSGLTTPQQQAIEGYLAQKWGLTSQLPVGHPGLTQTLYNSRAYQPRIPLVPQPIYQNFNPKQLSGCQLWLDGADPAGNGNIPANGSTVSTWYDKSGIGNNGTSYGNPTFNTSALNSKPGISFNGSTQRFVGAITNTGTTVSVFAIASMNSGGQWGRICSLAVTNNYDGGVSSLYFIPLIRSSTNQSIQSGRYQGSGNVNTSAVSITYNTPFQAASIVDGTTNTLYLNGTSSASASSTGNFGYTAYGIGAQPSDFQPEYFQGYISEIIVYNTALTTTQRQQVEGYLAWKWDLQTSLASGHPNITIPPGLPSWQRSLVRGTTSLPPIDATGGTITFSGSYKIHTFTTVGTTNFVVRAVNDGVSVQLLVVGGGGGGGVNCAGGGGAGGAIFVTSQTVKSGSYSIVVGAGGSGGINPFAPIYGAFGSNGGDSTGLGYTGIGGGGGGYCPQSSSNVVNGLAGGCGGGGAAFDRGAGGGTGGTSLQAGGFTGGTGASSGYTGGGGGGGMGSVGSNGSGNIAGSGGNGATYTIGGTAYTLAGGGGGGSAGGSTTSSGGSGGGGAGAQVTNTSGSNATYYGSGGGGGAGGGTPPKGGDGYQGIVIIAYNYL